MSQRAAKNIIWLSISRIAALLLLFFAYTQLFRYLGPTRTGQHQFVLSYVTIFGIIIDFGLQQYIVKKISAEPEKSKYYFQHFLAVELALAAVVYGLLILSAYFTNMESVVFSAVALAGLGMAINGLSYPFLAVMSAFQDLKKVAMLNFASSMVNVVFIFATILFKFGIVFLVANQLIFALISLFLYSRFIKGHIKEPESLKALRMLNPELVKQMLKAALPFAMLVGFSTIYNRIDMILISRLLGFTEAGIYAAAYKFFDLVSFFPAVVSHALYPVFTSALAAGNITSVKDNLEKYLRMMVIVALPMAVGGMVLSKYIIAIVAGPQFTDSAGVLSVLVWAPAILFIYIVANSIVISELTKFAVLICGVNVLINGIGNYLLLPKYGIMAAAIMTVVSEAIQGVFYFYFIWKKITHFEIFSFVWQPIVSSAIMGAVLVYLHNSFGFIASILVGGIVYVCCMVGTGGIKKSDIGLFKSVFKKGEATA